jgi:tRNA(Ile2) C34 agmatinyltransferase TiaS
MTISQLISDYRALGPQSENVLLEFIADHLYELRLANSARIIDPMDFKEALHDLAEALRMAEFPEGTVLPPSKVALAHSAYLKSPRVTRSNDPTCPRCGHVHEGAGECGVSMGKDRICRCEMEVVA